MRILKHDFAAPAAVLNLPWAFTGRAVGSLLRKEGAANPALSVSRAGIGGVYAALQLWSLETAP